MVALAALVCATLAVALPSASGRTVRPRENCGVPPDTSTHWEAVFGHTSSVSQAIVLRKQLAKKELNGIQFEKKYCDDIELMIPGFDSPTQRKAFAKEGDTSGVPVAFEASDNQKRNAQGELTAVFGRLPTLKRASALQGEIAVKGWRENDVVRAGLHSWKVIVMHIPASAQNGFASEAKGAGYKISFES